MKYLFVTVKRVGKRLPIEADYINYINQLKKQLDMTIEKQSFETDSHGRLHVHMIVLVTDRYNWNNLKLYKTNWHIHTLEIGSQEDLERISAYIDKEETDFQEFIKRRDADEYLFKLDFN